MHVLAQLLVAVCLFSLSNASSIVEQDRVFPGPELVGADAVDHVADARSSYVTGGWDADDAVPSSGEELEWTTAVERASVELAEDRWLLHRKLPGHASTDTHDGTDGTFTGPSKLVPHDEGSSARAFVRQILMLPEKEARYPAHRLIRKAYFHEGEQTAVELFMDLKTEKRALSHAHRFGVYSLNIREFFDLVAVKVGRNPADMNRFVEKMDEYWIDSVDEMATVTDAEYVAMGFPIKVVRGIRAVFDDITCKLRCEHGSSPNDDCSACEGCYGNWNGRNCDQWDPSKKSKDALREEIMSFKASSDARWAETRRKYKPLPGQVGFGVDMTTGQRRLPVALLTYNTSDRVWTNSAGTTYRIPKEAFFEPLPTGMSFPRSESIAYPTMGAYVHQLYQWSTDLKSKGGTYSTYDDLNNIYTQFFDGDNALAVSQQFWLVYKMSLPYNVKTFKRAFEVDPDCLAAMEWLPPDFSDPGNQELYQMFVETWGTSYSVETANGGILEQHSMFRKDLIATHDMTPDHIANQALKDFTRMHSGTSERIDKAYERERLLSGLICSGGDPIRCGNSPTAVRAWSQSIESNPIPVYYSIADISQLVPSETTAINIQMAIHAYIKKQLEAWASVDTCPPCGKYGSCKPPAEVCSCTNDRMSGRTCKSCKPGWSGATTGCSTPVCQNCPAERGVCESPGVCTCKEKWFGPGCGFCPPGYSTRDCATATCTPHCVNSRCMGPNVCKCPPKFKGKACSACEPGWTGATCSVGQRCFKCGGTGRLVNGRWSSTCPSCDGTGQIALNQIRCPKCKGQGYQADKWNNRYTCRGCKGEGYISDTLQTCFQCKGAGYYCANQDCSRTRDCRGCDGLGHIAGEARRCPRCGGSGSVTTHGKTESCKFCDGKGWA